MKTLNKKLLAAASIASKNSTRPVLGGVLFKDGKLVATDSYKLIEIGYSKNAPANEFPVKDQVIVEGEPNFVLSAEAILKNVKFKKNSAVLPILNDCVLVDETEKTVGIMQTDLQVMNTVDVPKIEGNFPDYEKIFPVEKAINKIIIDLNLLEEIVQAFKKSGSINALIEIRGKHEPLVMRDDDNEIRALIMPMKQ